MRASIAVTLAACLSASCASVPSPPAPCPQAPVSAPLSSPPPPIEATAAATRPLPAAFDPAPWLDDLGALTRAMSSHYANLDFAVHDRRLDLAKVKRRAEDRIRAATSDDDARRALRRFLNAFGDGHLDIDWAPASTSGGDASANAKAKQTGALCARLGYEDHERGGIDFALAGRFTPAVDDDARDVPGGVLHLAHGELGVARIDLFMESVHPALCEAARARLRLADDAACDEKCADRLQIAVGNLLTAALERRMASLARAGVDAVAVDLTANGGGSDWVGAAMRVVTPARLESRPVGAVRHAHWAKELGDRIVDLEADLATNGDVEHGAIASALVKMRAELAEVRTPCDQSDLWEEGRAKPTCSQLVLIAPVVPYAKPGALAGRSNVDLLFGPARYDYHEGANRLPLVVLVDGGTASAAEDFAEVLQDHKAAVIVGAETVGAGCGYTNGGIPEVLPHSRARVKMPDCARIRADGSNAVAGVTPDVVLPMLDRDSPYQRADKVVRGLTAAWGKVVGRGAGRPVNATSGAGH